jgi:hypothetical protein
MSAAIPPLARAELMVVLELYRAGVIREMYSRAEPGAVLVMETPTVETAAAALRPMLQCSTTVVGRRRRALRPAATSEPADTTLAACGRVRRSRAISDGSD